MATTELDSAQVTQTGWTGLIARSLDLFARLDPAVAIDAPTTVMADITPEAGRGNLEHRLTSRNAAAYVRSNESRGLPVE